MEDRRDVFRGALSPPGTRGQSLGLLFLVTSVFLASVSLGWIGYIGSDDVTYWSGGKGWLEHFPYVGGLGSSR